MATEKQHAWNNGGPPPRRLPHFHQPKLTSAQRDEIRQRIRDGERSIDLAVEFGVSRATVNRCR